MKHGILRQAVTSALKTIQGGFVSAAILQLAFGNMMADAQTPKK